ncbi:MAG: molybdopterin-guanine dinucleotide biosynthesis protein B [Chloroflexi bacterium]|nr:molybdopterin-guanine dinucleotide biosynthesis protein B [Chloroflexota bacterium]
MAVPVVSIVGRSNVGKTTFMEKLIRELKSRGYRVGTIKHYEHDFEIDVPGKDSWRHAQAGSDITVISSPQKIALIRRLEAELPLDEVVTAMPTVDIILTEGYKHENKPKIEVCRGAAPQEFLSSEQELIALVTDQPLERASVPQFRFDDASGVADLLEERYISAAKSLRSSANL